MDQLRQAERQRERGKCGGKRRHACAFESGDSGIADVLVDQVQRVRQRPQPNQYRRIEEPGAPAIRAAKIAAVQQ